MTGRQETTDPEDAAGGASDAEPDVGRYMALLNCQTEAEVYEVVRRWSSRLSDHEHLVRSTILDIQALLERRLKQLLYHVMQPLIFNGDEAAYQKGMADLERAITRMNFSAVHSLLRPALTAFPSEELADIGALNDVRNQVAHRDISAARYKGRNPFADADCLAQIYFDFWAADR